MDGTILPSCRVRICLTEGSRCAAVDGCFLWIDNTAKSDRYLRVTVLLNNDTAPFEGTLEFLTAQSSLEAYQYSYPLSLAAGEKFEQEYYIPLGVRADQMFVSVQDVNGKTIIGNV